MKQLFNVIANRLTPPAIVIGMHRSGTTMLAGHLRLMTVHIGTVLTRNTTESVHFQNINRSVLRALDSNWYDIKHILGIFNNPLMVDRWSRKVAKLLLSHGRLLRFFGLQQTPKIMLGRPTLWGWKDPRNSLMLPVYLALFPNAKVIHIVRNGIDVAISLHKRQAKYPLNSRDYCHNCAQFNFCFELWEHYVANCFQYTSSLPANSYLELRYEHVLQQPEQYVRQLSDFVGANVASYTLQAIVDGIDRDKLGNRIRRAEYNDAITQLRDSELLQALYPER